MNKFYETILSVLKLDDRFFATDGTFLRNAVYEAAMAMDKNLIHLLLSNPETKERYFINVDNVFVFDKISFGWTINNRQFLPDSYTRFKNKIGLADENGDLISNTGKVELVFPYKDCVLEGGQTKEDQKRDEVFYNETLAPDEVDRLLYPKVFVNAKRFQDGKEERITSLNEHDNLIIKGNNLLTISSLLKKYRNLIDLIYIDPPYNRKDGAADTFLYNNTFKRSTFLTFMKNRLDISKNLLSDSGVICIAIDDEEYAHLKVLCDEVFGDDNYIGTIVVQSNPSGTTSSSYFARCHEYCLFYAKKISEVVIKSFDLTIEQAKKYKFEDDEGNFKWRDFMRTGGTSTPEERPNSYYPIYFDPSNNLLSLDEKDGSIEVLPIDSLGNKRVWRQTRPSFLELNKKGELTCTIKNGKASIRIKDRIKEGMKPKTIWNDSKYSATTYGTGMLKEIFCGKKVFSYPKSLFTVKDIIKMVGDSDDIILDFFGGSGTTGHAVLDLNLEDGGCRKFILCEQMDYAYTVTFDRVKRVASAMNSNVGIVFAEIAKSNQLFVEKIQEAEEELTLNSIWNEMLETGFISSKVNPSVIDKEKKAKDYQDLSLIDKKRFLLEMLDKNQLYVNYCDIDDEEYAISDEDKSFTRSFYGE